MKTRFPLFFLSLAVFILSCKPSVQEEKTADDGSIINQAAKHRLDSTLKSLVDSGQIAGVSALIVEKNKEVYFNAFGYADREANVPMDRSTLVRIFSMTKPVTGTALMQLYEQGKFQLDDPLEKYAPEFANMKVLAGVDAQGKPTYQPVARPITIRDLTRHTAGFANAQDSVLGKLVQEADVMSFDNSLARMAQVLGKLPLAFNPGEKWSYGICVDVQAFLVERLSGKPFDVYVRENILDPLKMNDTRYVPQDLKKLAAVYRMNEEKKLERIVDEEANRFNGKVWALKPGGFGLTSSIDDYSRFARMLVNEGTLDSVTILKEETVRLMSTNALADSVTDRMWLPSKGQVGFGIDFAVRLAPPASPEENSGTVGEFFWDGAASTLFWVDPKNELVAVLFVQKFPFDNKLHKYFRDAVYGAR